MSENFIQTNQKLMLKNLLILAVLIAIVISIPLGCHNSASGMGVLESMDVDTLDTYIQTPAECKVTKVCSDQCKTKSVFFYNIAQEVGANNPDPIQQEAFNLVCIQRKWNPKEMFLSNVHKRMKDIIKGKTGPPIIEGKIILKTQKDWEALMKKDALIARRTTLGGSYIGKIPNPFLNSEYRDISVANLNCVKENLLYFRRLDKQCDEDPASVERLKRDANFDFKSKCGKMTPGELKSQGVISKILAESFLFLIKSGDEVTEKKFCQCRDFRKFQVWKRRSLAARRVKENKTKVVDPTLKQDETIFAGFSKAVDGYFVIANENCQKNKLDIAKSSKTEKKEKTKKLKNDKKAFEKGKNIFIETFNEKIQQGLAEVYAGLPWHVPTMKEWKAARTATNIAKQAANKAMKAAKKLEDAVPPQVSPKQ